MPSSAGIEAGAAMEITVSKANLLKELTATQGVVERKTTIPILANFLFEAAGDKLSITATDLDLSLRTSCPAKVKKDGSCTIPARKLHDYVKLLGDGVMFHFADPAGAVRSCLDMVDAAPRQGLPPAHVGVHAGPVVFRDGDDVMKARDGRALVPVHLRGFEAEDDLIKRMRRMLDLPAPERGFDVVLEEHGRGA